MWTIDTGRGSDSHAHLQGHRGCYCPDSGISISYPDTFGNGISSTFKDVPYPNVLSGFDVDFGLTSHVGRSEQSWSKNEDSLETPIYEARLYSNDLGGSSGRDLIQTAPGPSIPYGVVAQTSTSHEDAALFTNLEYPSPPDPRDGSVHEVFSHSSKITKPSLMSEPHQRQVRDNPASSSGSHKCRTCSRACNNLRSLREHMRSHVKPHACEAAGCEERFSTARDLERHRKSIHKRAISQCLICHKHIKGARADNLRRHMRTHQAGSST
ncbi:hypothetical protein LZ30DRAFT_771311 [Colletotrichum cereale]|nr:hypothetical protein LZ30DRAFT_771311 [Colletotrichum cereale]